MPATASCTTNLATRPGLEAGGRTGLPPTGATVVEHIFANSFDIATINSAPGTASALYYNHTDQLNSSAIMSYGAASAAASAAGTVAETMDYYPYGKIRIDAHPSTGSGSSAFSEQRKFIGQYFDPSTQLSYLNARYYNSNIGRFTSQDPVFLSQNQNLKDPQSFNSYSYANNNPIVLSDPSGKFYEFSADLTFPGISGGIGFQWDNTGLNFKYSFGTGIGLKGNLPISVSENNEELPHSFQSSAVVGGSGAVVLGFDISRKGQIINNTYESNENWQVSKVVGVGAGAYAKKEYSLPLIGKKPTNVAVGPSFLCAPDNIQQPVISNITMISSPATAGLNNNQIQNFSYTKAQISVLQQQVSLLKQLVNLQTQLNQQKVNQNKKY